MKRTTFLSILFIFYSVTLVSLLTIFLLQIVACQSPTSSTSPLQFTGKTSACSNFFSFIEDVSGNYVLSVYPSVYPSLLDSDSVEYPQSDRYVLKIYRLSEAHKINGFCNDVPMQVTIVDSFPVHSASIYIRKYDKQKGQIFDTFLLDIHLTNVTYSGPDGESHLIQKIRLDSLGAGWLP
jgi:hypothetical protein